MLDYGISVTLIASALDEVAQNPDLIKLSAAGDADERDLFQFLQENLGTCREKSAAQSTAWIGGLKKYADEHNAHGLVKQALLGVDMHPGLDIPLTIGAYMTPVLGTGLMAADAGRNFYKMFGKNMGWKQRLGHGMMGLMDSAFAGVSLLPGLGTIGAAAKFGKLGKMLGKLGPRGVALAGRLGKGVDVAARGAKGMRAAAGSKGLQGSVLRGLGFGEAYKSGKIRNWFRRAAGRPTKDYANPFSRLGQWEGMMTQMGRATPAQMTRLRAGKTVSGLGKGFGKLRGMTEAAGGKMITKPFTASMAVDNPGWRRLMLGMTPMSMAGGTMSGMGPGPSTSSSELYNRLPGTAARHAKRGRRLVPLMRTRAGGVRRL
jgi:hypothetical protein